MTDKPPPPVPGEPFDVYPRVPVDEADPDVVALVRAAAVAADNWMLGPDGLRKHPTMSTYDLCRRQVTEGLLHLLELGLVDIDRERLAAMRAVGMPLMRVATP